jgi:hypothetical protein
MPTPFLALNVFSGTPQAKLFNGTQTSNLGVTFGAADTGRTAPPFAAQRIIQFGPTDTWYAVTGSSVYRTTDAGASWSSVLTLTSLNAQQNIKTGLYICYLDGIPRLSLFWNRTLGFGSSDWTIASSANGTTWTTTAVNLTTFDYTGSHTLSSQFLYRNKIFAFWYGSANIIIGDPGSNSITIASSGLNSSSSVAFGTFNGDLYALYRVEPGIARLAIYSGGGFVVVATLIGSGVNNVAKEFGLLADGVNLYCFVYNTTATGWQCYQVTSTYTVTNITASIIPPGMTGTTGGGNAPDTSLVRIMVDQEASPGVDPIKYIYFTRSPQVTDSWSVFQWMGNATQMQQIDSGGGNGAMALSLPIVPTGSYNWADGENTVVLLDRSPLLGALRLYFALYSDSGVAVVSVNAFTASLTQEYPTTVATLTNPSSGSMSGNTITGLVANNGATTYEVTWQAATDGFDSGDAYSIILEVAS